MDLLAGAAVQAAIRLLTQLDGCDGMGGAALLQGDGARGTGHGGQLDFQTGHDGLSVRSLLFGIGNVIGSVSWREGLSGGSRHPNDASEESVLALEGCMRSMALIMHSACAFRKAGQIQQRLFNSRCICSSMR